MEEKLKPLKLALDKQAEENNEAVFLNKLQSIIDESLRKAVVLLVKEMEARNLQAPAVKEVYKTAAGVGFPRPQPPQPRTYNWPSEQDVKFMDIGTVASVLGRQYATVYGWVKRPQVNLRLGAITVAKSTYLIPNTKDSRLYLETLDSTSPRMPPRGHLL